ncbi:hypothetical protein V9T40_008025 [Parthenolecanium corni]|uniref:Uncharacterized protein n=1 Tax=Parthenolecanium corni TaxID=536013 RepID=A0AAN9Y7Y5_9HEMI
MTPFEILRWTSPRTNILRTTDLCQTMPPGPLSLISATNDLSSLMKYPLPPPLFCYNQWLSHKLQVMVKAYLKQPGSTSHFGMKFKQMFNSDSHIRLTDLK